MLVKMHGYLKTNAWLFKKIIAKIILKTFKKTLIYI